MKIQIFETNSLGKDYICADVHGCFDALEKQLQQVNFNPTQDRLFSLGDLIDRGKQSDAVLEWLNQPWFHAIQGNHEWMFIQSFEKLRQTSELKNALKFACRWPTKLSIRELEAYYSAFCKLPLAIELHLPESKIVGLVHAQLPLNCDWRQVKTALQNNDETYITAISEDLLWSKTQAYRRNIVPIKAVKNLDHVFHGHAIVEKIRTYANRSFLDLGSYKTGKIGLVEPLAFLKQQSPCTA